MIFEFFGCIDNLVNFGLVYSFDIGELFLSGHENGGNCAEASSLEFDNIGNIDAALLELLNFGKSRFFEFFIGHLLLFAGLLLHFFLVFLLLKELKSYFKKKHLLQIY